MQELSISAQNSGIAFRALGCPGSVQDSTLPGLTELPQEDVAAAGLQAYDGLSQDPLPCRAISAFLLAGLLRRGVLQRLVSCKLMFAGLLVELSS